MNSLSYLTSQDQFPSPHLALEEPNGLLAIGGDLSPTRLLDAYYQGIFPWFNFEEPILWWSPNPRAVFKPQFDHGSKSLKKFLRKQKWQYRVNSNFEGVITACAQPRAYEQSTWITNDIIQAYTALHRSGRAHSIEVWDDNELVGGLYGISMGGVFCGESMFHTQTNASKAAFMLLNQLLSQHDYHLIDAQIINPHLLKLGAKPITRDEFLNKLTLLRDKPEQPHLWQPREVTLEL
ncbi:leucyl/phenylalanyl-tRNA--protein transferase [Shewanella maritima]|uniref:leucyl/phenylalanyl-tRNA--protein transferase n=1 Tax=Shewanella maritima TaxID=2520507 RepID=UPI00373533D4